MPIMMPTSQNGPSPALEKVAGTVTGYLKGGPAGAALGFLGASHSNSPLAGLASMKRRLDNAQGEESAQEGDTSQQQPQDENDPVAKHLDPPQALPAANDDNPMSRRLSVAQEDPMASIHQGLTALNDPSVPHDIRMAYAPMLLQAKHFQRPIG